MGPIAATLLCYFEPERVYVSMVRLHEAYDLHRLFSPGFPGLLEAIYLQERITQLMMPEVYAAFRKHMISTTSYATKWYITLFANSVPFQTQLRLWDIFLLEGPDVFVAVAVAIVWVYRGAFLELVVLFFLRLRCFFCCGQRSNNIWFCQFRDRALSALLVLRTTRRRLAFNMDQQDFGGHETKVKDGELERGLEASRSARGRR
jgi:hypothetical protein